MPPAVAGTAGSVDNAAPQRARYDAKTDKLELLGPCFDAQREPLVVGGETLVLKVRAEDGLPFASRVRPMRLFIASVSRNADPVILDAAHFRSLQSEPRQEPNDLVAAIPIERGRGRSAAVRAGDARPQIGHNPGRNRVARDVARASAAPRRSPPRRRSSPTASAPKSPTNSGSPMIPKPAPPERRVALLALAGALRA